jgi:hypothetical protein
MCAPCGEIQVSRPEFRPASRICYLQATEIVKTTARTSGRDTWRNVSDSGRNPGQVAVFTDEETQNC